MIDVAQHPTFSRLTEFCEQRAIRRLAVFGSALRDDFGADSDLDILVEFKSGATPGLAFFAIQEELSHLMGRTVDLQTPECLSPYFREDVLARARDLYVAS